MTVVLRWLSLDGLEYLGQLDFPDLTPDDVVQSYFEAWRAVCSGELNAEGGGWWLIDSADESGQEWR